MKWMINRLAAHDAPIESIGRMYGIMFRISAYFDKVLALDEKPPFKEVVLNTMKIWSND